jgi:hypothetical protein
MAAAELLDRTAYSCILLVTGRMFQPSARNDSGRRWRHWTLCDC